MIGSQDIAAITIGRNEGLRLIACLEALQGQVAQVVYVDSGSSDDSVKNAIALGADVVELDMTVPFTAARARNAGRARLIESGATQGFIQFLDGDCVMQDEWLEVAREFLLDHPEVAVVCGRRRERHPEASLYNALIDAEWNGPTGAVKACGGDALMRLDALDEVGGFDPALIAGEEPELCVRLRKKGWTIWRLPSEMTLHDAELTRFGQWWQRSRRAGFAYAQGFAMHGHPPERHKAQELKRALIWGIVLPAIAVCGLFLTPIAPLIMLLFPLQMLRLRTRGHNWPNAIFLTLAKLPEGQGALQYYLRKLTRRPQRLIEYK